MTGPPSIHETAKRPGFKGFLKDLVGYDDQVLAAASTTETLLASVKASGGVAQGAKDYVRKLFPFITWIGFYNPTWAMGDLIAGLTVGMVLVPQSMSYAKIATLDPEYGLYSSFVGVIVYALFATSKDVTIGPVAVMSLLVSKVISDVQGQAGGEVYSAPVIATALAFMTGFIVLGIGLLRLGWIIEFIPVPAVAGFMTGSAISIASGQVAGLMGYSSAFNTRDSTYKVIINSFKYLGHTKMDAAFGLTGLVFLYFARWSLGRLEKSARSPLVRRLAFFAVTLRTAFVIIVLTLASWLYLRNKTKAHYPISVLGTVPSGFQHMGSPLLSRDLFSRLAPQLPVATIVLLLEHIAIAKSFGRINNYKIDPNQELIAIGVTNTIGTLFNAYPATGSFSRSAIKAKAGVRTPLAGWVVGVVVVVALYALTGAFYWIPNAALAAVIIHAVGDLVASPKQVYSFWKVSPCETLIWFAAVLLSVFTTIEIGVYVSVAASGALLLFRIARPRGRFLGRVRLREESDDSVLYEEECAPLSSSSISWRDVYIPLEDDGVHNPHVRVDDPVKLGVVVFRPDESLVYVNASYCMDQIVDRVHATTRSGQDFNAVKPGDRPWNDPGPPKKGKGRSDASSDSSVDSSEEVKPLLRAIIFDFAGVSSLDTTATQALVDLRRTVERYADSRVEFYFAGVKLPWIRRALLAGAFGTARTPGEEQPLEIAATTPGGLELIKEEFQRRYLSPPGTPRRNNSFAVRDTSPFSISSRLEMDAGSGAASPLPGAGASSTTDPGKLLQVPGGGGGARGGGGWDKEGNDAASVEAAITSNLYPRFTLDVASAMRTAVGRDKRW